MAVLILGGTGAMGKYITNILVEKGFNVVDTSGWNKTEDGLFHLQRLSKNSSFIMYTRGLKDEKRI